MLVLTRLFEVPGLGTWGRLDLHTGGDLWTLEPPWRGNEVGESCIPAGTYRIERDETGQYQNFRVCDVPGRDAIEFHLGNLPSETTGCILLGLSRGVVSGEWAVMQSGAAVDAFMCDLDGVEESRLLILGV